MPDLNRIWIGALGALVVVAASRAIVVYSGWVNVAVDSPHGPMLERLLEMRGERSIARRIGDVAPAADLFDAE